MQFLLDELIAGSSGSQLISYTFESKELRFQLYHPAAKGLVLFEVATDTVHGRTVSADPKRSTCRLDLIDLKQCLDVRDGRYQIPTIAAKFLDHARERITIAYGRRASEFGWLLRLDGQYPLLACLVRDPADIRWTVE